MSRPDPVRPAVGEFENLLTFERLISDLSTRFIHLPSGEVDREIEAALDRVCGFLGIDFAVLWQWSASSPDVIMPTHVYRVAEVPEISEPMDQEQYPWARQQMLAGRPVVISSLSNYPAEAAVDRETCRRVGIRSGLCLPLSVGGEPPVGALGLNSMAEREWPDALVQRLQLVAQVFTNALARCRHEVSLRESEARLAAGADLAGLAFYEVDFAEGFAFADERFRDICGLPPAQGEKDLRALEFWEQNLHPDDRGFVSEQRQQLQDGRLERVSVEYRFLNPIRGERWIHHLARATRRDANGQMLRTFGVIRDITERRRAEAEIERLKDRLQAESDYLKAEILVAQPHGAITGRSEIIQNVLRQVEQVARTGSTVLILGETGTGKELVANAIHRLSPRRHHIMVKVNCAALPTGLVESELFGRERGAYTGAMSRQVGRFEVADGSTLFLDEVGELPPEVQVKLLRVLETGEFERLGSPRTIKVDVRVIAATHRDLSADIRAGRFREDLYYRLAVFPIRVPPLRERAEDIPLLVWAFLEEYSSRMGKKITQVPRKMMEALQRHPWPGNIRELRNVIEHGAILTEGRILRLPLLDETAAGGARVRTLAEAERAFILLALEQAGGRVKGPHGAAEVLGLKPATLYGRMKKLGIRPHHPPESGSA